MAQLQAFNFFHLNFWRGQNITRHSPAIGLYLDSNLDPPNLAPMNPNHLQFLNACRRLRSGPLATAAMSGPHHRPNGLAGLLAGICNLGSQTRLSTILI